jgi:predicted neutral ceramidase superfamily lipid hydrolase
MYTEETQSAPKRDSPGIFGYLNRFKKRKYTILFSILFFLCAGLSPFITNYLVLDKINYMFIIRNGLTFLILVYSGTVASIFFKRSSPILEFDLAFLINLFGGGVFFLSTFLGDLVALLLDSFVLSPIFFMIGSIVCYVAMFVIFFSFTTVGRPWYIFLALIQPTLGIIFYSFFEEQLTIEFFVKAFIFFMSVAFLYAVIYGPAMNVVSLPYRREKGIGGYNMVRAFVLSLLTENHDDQIEYFFQKEARIDTLKIKYLAFRPKSAANQVKDSDFDSDSDLEYGQNAEIRNIKGLFILPNIHFGPFKTAGSAALPEHIYSRFADIPGLTVFHSTVTHGENLVSSQYNAQVVKQIIEDCANFKFLSPKITKFQRILHGQSKILGFSTEKTPYLFISRHPLPTDDIMPAVGDEIKNKGSKKGFNTPFIVDCHNAIVGDEVLISEKSPEGIEIVDSTEKFFEEIKKLDFFSDLQYGCARVKSPFPIEAGIGSGGIVCHYFKIGKQKSVLIHVDSNNALLSVRSQIVNHGQNKGIDRIELTTSDTHNVVRVISARGYHPLGDKVKLDYLIPTIDKLIDEAEKNAEPVDIAEYESETPNFPFWPNVEYFNLITETIQKCLVVSKFLLTIGLVIPALFSLLSIVFLFGNGSPI